MAGSTFFKQFIALMKRNFILKKRNKKQTLQEILYPIYFVLILVIIRITTKPTQRDAVPLFPENNISMSEYLPKSHSVVYVSPDTEEVNATMTQVMAILASMGSTPRVEYFPSERQAEEEYLLEKDQVGLGVHFDDDTPWSLKYTLRAPFGTIPTTDNLYGGQGQCRDESGLGGCDANKYLFSGFVNMQRAIDAVLTANRTQLDQVLSAIQVQLFPKSSWTPDVSYLQTLASIYFVMAYSPFVNFLTVSLVAEKEKKIREAMRMMGLRDPAFWFSWGVTYAVIIFVVTGLCVLLTFATSFFPNSDIFIFFLMLFLYGLTIISMAFMITPFFSRADKAGGLASLATMVFSLLYLPVTLTRDGMGPDGPESSIPEAGQWALCLLSPVALALAVDQAIYLDISGGGMTWENMNVGQFPLSHSMTMLAVDFVLYGLLALYFDNVIPNEFGQKKKPYFFLLPSFWCPRTKHPTNEEMVSGSRDQRQFSAVTMDDGEDIEEISHDLRGKDAIKIFNIKKEYKGADNGKPVRAVNGISLDIYEDQITCLVGHNGAGKSTLINMLTGLTPPSKGTSTIYGYDVENPGDLNEIRSMTGVCPQHNVLFDDLTCDEHLQFFAALKGVPSGEIEAEVTQALKDLDMTEKAETRGNKLSGGQKRKLCVAIALIGDPKVIFLDEPTSGMDPYSRRHLWSVLKDQRKGKVIVLTTHFMDEADILADRKAFISKGRLQCVGSSLFLKNRFGVGYHLGLVVDSCDDATVSQVTSLVKRHVEEAELNRCHGKEIYYTLPLQSVAKFADLFSDLDKHSGSSGAADNSLAIRSYGVSMTTLEEVFLKLGEQEEAEEEADDGEEHDRASTPLLRSPQISPGNVNLAYKKQDTSSKRGASGEDVTCSDGQIARAQSQAGDRDKLSFTNQHSIQNAGVPASGASDIQNNASSTTSGTSKMPAENVSANGDDVTWRRFKALVKVRFTVCKRNKTILFFRIVLPVIFVVIGAALQAFINPTLERDENEALELTASLYSRVGSRSRSNPNMTYKYGASRGPDEEAFVQEMMSQGIYLTQINNSTDLLDMEPHHAGVTVYNVSHLVSSFFADLTAMYNDTATHSLPVVMNTLANAVLGMLSSANETITTFTKRWPNLSPGLTGWNNSVFSSTILLGLAVAVIPPGFGIAVVKERQIKARSQLRISGVSMNMYWGTVFFVDVIQFAAACLLSIVVLVAFQTPSLMYSGAIVSLLLLYIFYIPVNMFFAYILSFAFDKYETAQTVIFNIFFLGSFIPYMAVAMLDMFGEHKAAQIVHIVLLLIDPPYAVFGGLYYISRVYFLNTILQGTDDPDIPFSEYFEWGNNIIIAYVAPLVHGLWMYFALRALEIKKTGGSYSDVCCGSGYSQTGGVPEENTDVIAGEDEDVRAEREKIQRMSANPAENDSVVLVCNLRKEFPLNSNSCSGKKGKESSVKVAVRNNSFAVQKGEVFGLLGPNGAGKTTTLNMVIAEEGPTKGKVHVNGYDIRSSLSEAFQAMGYCAQHDPLWDEITLREHLECYATVHGIAAQHVDAVVHFFIESLKIEEHQNKQAKTLSGGTKRKLSYAMSMLGDPKVVLLDEPSTGMDPKSKRFLWDTITESFSGNERGAILTTHYMEEADALCSRVGIMVNGQLECLGSTQHLKSKYGSGYLLEIKLDQLARSASADGGTERKERLLEFVRKLFPSSVEIETFGDRSTYAIPQGDVSSLAQVFSTLEKGKALLGVEEYSFSQSTLEQVFLEFAKHQADELNENESESDPLMKRKSVMKQNSVEASAAGGVNTPL